MALLIDFSLTFADFLSEYDFDKYVKSKRVLDKTEARTIKTQITNNKIATMKNITIVPFLCAVLMASASAFAAEDVKPTVTIDKAPNLPPGPNGTDEITGKVSGVKPTECKVVVYAYGDKWYVQPTKENDEEMTEIKKDLNWSNTTHGGIEYAALLVKPTFAPADTYKSHELPKEGGDVLAVTKLTPKKN